MNKYRYPHQLELLTRDNFRDSVFQRDNNKCVICSSPGEDAHHIIERRLFDDGGYYLDNGVTLCEKCHINAEKTLLSCEYLRHKANIRTIVLPSHFYSDQNYDKWGNIVLHDGARLKGELFNDCSVQKILGGIKFLFAEKIKYPRTYHLPWSRSLTNDDRIIKDLISFENQDIVVTEKMDGEQTTMYKHSIHARSVNSKDHVSRHWVKNLHSKIAYDIPDGWRICGENLYAKHSIYYKNLESYFMVFNIWDENNFCLPWDETEQWCSLLDLNCVPVLYKGIFDKNILMELTERKHNESGDETEGYVVRLSKDFHYSQFRKYVAKYVRANHIHTHGHWMRDTIIPNELFIDC